MCLSPKRHAAAFSGVAAHSISQSDEPTQQISVLYHLSPFGSHRLSIPNTTHHQHCRTDPSLFRLCDSITPRPQRPTLPPPHLVRSWFNPRTLPHASSATHRRPAAAPSPHVVLPRDNPPRRQRQAPHSIDKSYKWHPRATNPMIRLNLYPVPWRPTPPGPRHGETSRLIPLPCTSRAPLTRQPWAALMMEALPPTTTRRDCAEDVEFRRACIRGVGQDQDQSADTPGFNMFATKPKMVLPVSMRPLNRR